MMYTSKPTMTTFEIRPLLCLHAPGLVFLQSDIEEAAVAMRDEFELSGGGAFQPLAAHEAATTRLSQALAHAAAVGASPDAARPDSLGLGKDGDSLGQPANQSEIALAAQRGSEEDALGARDQGSGNRESMCEGSMPPLPSAAILPGTAVAGGESVAGGAAALAQHGRRCSAAEPGLAPDHAGAGPREAAAAGLSRTPADAAVAGHRQALPTALEVPQAACGTAEGPAAAGCTGRPAQVCEQQPASGGADMNEQRFASGRASTTEHRSATGRPDSSDQQSASGATGAHGSLPGSGAACSSEQRSASGGARLRSAGCDPAPGGTPDPAAALRSRVELRRARSRWAEAGYLPDNPLVRAVETFRVVFAQGQHQPSVRCCGGQRQLSCKGVCAWAVCT